MAGDDDEVLVSRAATDDGQSVGRDRSRTSPDLEWLAVGQCRQEPCGAAADAGDAVRAHTHVHARELQRAGHAQTVAQGRDAHVALGEVRRQLREAFGAGDRDAVALGRLDGQGQPGQAGQRR